MVLSRHGDAMVAREVVLQRMHRLFPAEDGSTVVQDVRDVYARLQKEVRDESKHGGTSAPYVLCKKGVGAARRAGWACGYHIGRIGVDHAVISTATRGRPILCCPFSTGAEETTWVDVVDDEKQRVAVQRQKTAALVVACDRERDNRRDEVA